MSADTPDVGLTEQERRMYEGIEDSGDTQKLAWRVEQTVTAHVAAERERAEDDRRRIAAALLALAAEIADGRVQRPGMQRRRQWADRIRAALGGETIQDKGKEEER